MGTPRVGSSQRASACGALRESIKRRRYTTSVNGSMKKRHMELFILFGSLMYVAYTTKRATSTERETAADAIVCVWEGGLSGR